MHNVRLKKLICRTLALVAVAAVSVACGAATGQPGAAGTDSLGAQSETLPPGTDATATTTLPADTDTAAAPDSVQVDSPYTFDFSKPLVMDNPGSKQIASTDELKTAAVSVPSPVVVSGLAPTAIFSFRDGEGIAQSFDDPQYGQFWFDQFLAPDTVSGMPDACISCDAKQSGRVKLSDGQTAVVWVSNDDQPSSITWYSDGVEYLVMGPGKALTRDGALKIAELVVHSPRA